MPKAKTPSLLDEARAMPKGSPSRHWFSKLSGEQQGQIRDLAKSKANGEQLPDFKTLGELIRKRFDLHITKEHIAEHLGQLTREFENAKNSG